MLTILITWLIIGIIITYLKMHQSRQIGFDRRINFSTLHYFVIGILLWPLILFYYFQEQKSYREITGYGVSGINDYFVNAVHAWIWGIYKEAEVAALAAAKVAGKEQRKSMLDHLSQMASRLQKNFPEDLTMKRHGRRLLNLYEEIASRDWTVIDADEEKQRLHECNPELLKALNKADANIFVRLYPILFGKKTVGI
ncbi:MAG TPA: hypothetical protein ACFYEG_05795 [Candidatus Wujingus californicus]|uniref:hypothetical protein n=1 Tax=Candidatus Wujingus californicus TaxID=3367618 RepID=UPI004025C5E5